MSVALLALAASERATLDLDAGEGDAGTGAAQGGETLADEVRAGSLFGGRFLMKHALWAKSLDRDLRNELVPLPSEMHSRFQNTQELLAGSFGETWAAYDRQLKRPVALKMFYSTDAQGNRFHITWAQAKRDEALTSNLQAAAGECLTARKLQIFALSDPEGASRLMQCYEDHVTCEECKRGQASGRSSSGHEVRANQALYQVLEDCSGDGGKPLSHWIKEKVSSPDYYRQALVIFKEMVQGLEYMTSSRHNVKWTHHDLKPDNVIVKVVGGKEYTKLIDFGGVSEITRELAMSAGLASTAFYAPPEWAALGGTVQFDASYPSSFDMYSAGCILHEMFSGTLVGSKFLGMLPANAQQDIHRRCRGDQNCMFQTAVAASKSTVEKPMTRGWGVDPGATNNGFNFLFGQVDGAYLQAAKHFMQRIIQAKFAGFLVAMLSSAPGQRPTPRQVLDAPFFQGRRTEPDPQFDANLAQTNAETAYKSIG